MALLGHTPKRGSKRGSKRALLGVLGPYMAHIALYGPYRAI